MKALMISKGVALVVVLAIGCLASAKLSPSKFFDLVAESDLIVDASPKKLERTGPVAGEATFRILMVVSGSFDGSEISIKWSGEEHDRAITSLESDYFLFLKKDKDRYTGTRYGVSYWPILGRVVDPKRADLGNPSRVVTFPFGGLTLTSKEKKQLLPQSGGRANSTVPVKDLVAHIRKAKAHPVSK